MALETYVTQPGVPVGPRGVIVDLPCVGFATLGSFNNLVPFPGLLHSLTISPLAGGTFQLWDNTTQSGTVIYGPVTFVAGNPFTLIFDIIFTIGISVTETVLNSPFTLSVRQR